MSEAVGPKNELETAFASVWKSEMVTKMEEKLKKRCNFNEFLDDREQILYDNKRFEECSLYINSVHKNMWSVHLAKYLVRSYLNMNEREAAESVANEYNDKSDSSDDEDADDGMINVNDLLGAYNPLYLAENTTVPVLHSQNPKISKVCNKAYLGFSENLGHHMIAKDNIKLGEIILIEEPYASIGYAKCAACFNNASLINPCANCDATYYCSDECFDEHNHIHKFECAYYQCVESDNLTAKLALRIFLTCIENGMDSTEELSGNNKMECDDPFEQFPYMQQRNENFKKSFYYKFLLDALVKHSCNLTSYILCCKPLKTKLKNKMIFKNTTEDEFIHKLGYNLLRLLLICELKSIFIFDDVLHNTNEFYPTLSLFKFSCQSNTIIYRTHNKIIMKALEDIEAGKIIYCRYIEMSNTSFLSVSMNSVNLAMTQLKCDYFCNGDETLYNCLNNSAKIISVGCIKKKIDVIIPEVKKYFVSKKIDHMYLALKCANEIMLRGKDLTLQAIYFAIIVDEIKLENLNNLDKYLLIIMEKQYIDLFKNNHIEICMSLRKNIKPIFYYLEKPESLFNTLVSYFKFIEKYLCIFFPCKDFLEIVRVLIVFYGGIQGIQMRRNNTAIAFEA